MVVMSEPFTPVVCPMRDDERPWVIARGDGGGGRTKCESPEALVRDTDERDIDTEHPATQRERDERDAHVVVELEIVIARDHGHCRNCLAVGG